MSGSNDPWNWCTCEAALAMAGKDHPTVSATGLSGAILSEFSKQVEADMNVKTRRDWIAVKSSIGANFSGALARAEAAGVAIKIINWDANSYPGLAYAQNALNVNSDIYNH